MPILLQLAGIRAGLCLTACLLLAFVRESPAVILWSDLGATLVHDTGAGSSFLTGSAMDILGGAMRADDSSTNTLYFKFHLDPLSDVTTEEYFAAFQLYDGGVARLALGNSLKAWTYCAFNTDQTGEANKVFGDMDLRSSKPETAIPGGPVTYEFPRRGNERTIVFKVQYVPGGKDRVTVWLNPDLSPGATEAGQSENLITRFTANASFTQIRLRHGGGGGGWTFSDMAIATSFGDFVASSSIESADSTADYPRSAVAINVRTWQRDQGLPQNAIRALAQTRDGYLWAGTDEGIVRFDGLRFAPFGLQDGLRGGAVRVLFGDSRGALWIGGSGSGLSRWEAGGITTVTFQDGLPSDSITALAEDRSGRLWVGTDAGLAIWHNGSLTSWTEATRFKGRKITALFRDRQGDMWMGVYGLGVFQYHDGRFTQLRDASVDALLVDSHCLLMDQRGRLWVGAGDDYVLCHEGSQWHRYRIPRHMARPYVNTLAEEPDGTVWAGSVSEGLFQFRGGKLAAFNAGSGLLDNQVESLLVDREGKLWVGTETGLSRLRRKILFSFGQNDGLGQGAVQGLAEIASGSVMVAKTNDGLYHWDGRRFEHLAGAGANGLADFEPRSLLKAQDGGCWVGGSSGLMYFNHTNALRSRPDRVALEGRNILSLAEDADGGIWAGCANGELWRQQGINWVAQTNLWNEHPVTAIAPASDGSVWIGTDGDGLHRLDKAGAFHLSKADGLLSDSIRTLYPDSSGTLWIGTAGGGLSWWNNEHLKTVTTREGLPDNTISQIMEDSSGRLWLGCNRGIVSISKRDLNEFGRDKINMIFPKVYGTAEGMLSEECTGGFFPAGLKTRSGLMWFSTAKGVVVADARPHASDSLAPKAILEEMFVDGMVNSDFRARRMTSGRIDALPAAGAEEEALRIPPGRHHLEFRYTGLSFDNPERIRFRYRLQGLDADWVEAGTRRVAIYNYVPPGEYHFQVVACNSDGVWGETGDGVSLVVEAHLWQTWWMLVLGAIGLLAAVGGVARIVEKRKLHRRLAQLEQERALQRERARIAQDLHDDLGSSLARISLLSGLAKVDKDNPAQVELHVTKIAQSAAQTVQALEEIVWAVRPGSDSLQSLIEYISHFATELFEENNARCRLDLPHDFPPLPLPPDVRHNIFLVVKEALTNAFKHASASEVRLEAGLDAGVLQILIQDNGGGFDPESSNVGSGRNGLGNMQRRSEALGGKLTVQSGRGKGTTIRLNVDVSKSAAVAAP